MTTTIFIAVFILLIATLSFFAIHRHRISLKLESHVFGSLTKGIMFNAVILLTTILAIWQTYNAIFMQLIYVPRRGYSALWINPGDDSISFVLYLMFYGFIVGAGIGLITKMLKQEKKV